MSEVTTHTGDGRLIDRFHVHDLDVILEADGVPHAVVCTDKACAATWPVAAALTGPVWVAGQLSLSPKQGDRRLHRLYWDGDRTWRADGALSAKHFASADAAYEAVVAKMRDDLRMNASLLLEQLA